MSNTAESIVGAVQSTLRDYDMLPGPGPVLVAVSGGPDSVCLLTILHELGYALRAAHFNHRARGQASEADASFVRGLAERLGLPLHMESADVEDLARDSSSSFEEVARDLRYDFLFKAARSADCGVVATGHHADDQAETVLMRILRGTTPSGLGGIPPCTEREGLRIIRPLIRLPRESVLRYLHERGCPFRVDESNRDTRYLRNRVRHELIPQLTRQYNPRLREALGRLSESLYSENELLAALTSTFLSDCLSEDGTIDRKGFRKGHPALQRRAILRLAWDRGVDCPFDVVDGAARFVAQGPTGNFFDLGGGVQLCNGRSATTLGAAETAKAGAGEAIPLAVPGETIAFGKRVEIRRLPGCPEGSLAAYCSSTRQVFDGDSLTGPVSLRHRREGDRFTPLGMKGSKKLKDYLSDLGTPVTQRDAQLLLTGGGQILWVVGHAVSARAAVTEATENLFEVEVTNETE